MTRNECPCKHLPLRTENFRAEIENKGKGEHKRHQRPASLSWPSDGTGWRGVAGILIMLILQPRCHNVSNAIQNGPNEIKQDSDGSCRLIKSKTMVFARSLLTQCFPLCLCFISAGSLCAHNRHTFRVQPGTLAQGSYAIPWYTENEFHPQSLPLQPYSKMTLQKVVSQQVAEHFGKIIRC